MLASQTALRNQVFQLSRKYSRLQLLRQSTRSNLNLTRFESRVQNSLRRSTVSNQLENDSLESTQISLATSFMKLSDFVLYLQTHAQDPEPQYDQYCLLRFADVLLEANRYVKMNIGGKSTLQGAGNANKLEVDVDLDLLDSKIEDRLNSLTTVNPIFVKTRNMVQPQKPGFTYVRQFESAPTDLSSLERMQLERRAHIRCVLTRMKY